MKIVKILLVLIILGAILYFAYSKFIKQPDVKTSTVVATSTGSSITLGTSGPVKPNRTVAISESVQLPVNITSQTA